MLTKKTKEVTTFIFRGQTK